MLFEKKLSFQYCVFTYHKIFYSLAKEIMKFSPAASVGTESRDLGLSRYIDKSQTPRTVPGTSPQYFLNQETAGSGKQVMSRQT